MIELLSMSQASLCKTTCLGKKKFFDLSIASAKIAYEGGRCIPHEEYNASCIISRWLTVDWLNGYVLVDLLLKALFNAIQMKTAPWSILYCIRLFATLRYDGICHSFTTTDFISANSDIVYLVLFLTEVRLELIVAFSPKCLAAAARVTEELTTVTRLNNLATLCRPWTRI